MHSRAFPCIPCLPRILQDWSTSQNGNYERSQFWTFPAIRLLKKSASALEKEVAHQISPLILSTPNPDYTCPTPSRPRMTVRKNKKKSRAKENIHSFPRAPHWQWTEGTCLTTAFHHMTKLLKVGRGVTPLRCYSPMTCCTEGGVWHARSKSSPTINHSLLSTCL